MEIVAKTNKKENLIRKAVVAITLLFAISAFFIINGKLSAIKQVEYSEGFEANTASWTGSGSINRVASGTDGINSSTGSYHAIVSGSPVGPHTELGGYNSQWPGEWESSIDAYLDPSWPDGTGIIYSVATNNTEGTFLRDYILHAGIVNDETTGNTNKLLLIADNHGVPEDDTTFQIRHPSMHDRRIEISQADWYTISHRFYNTEGRLLVDISVAKKDGPVIKTWTLDTINDEPEYHVTIPGNVGGNRYGWVTHVSVPGGVAIDNVTRSIDGTTYGVSPNAADPVSLTVEDSQTIKLLGTENGTVTAPTDITIINPSANAEIQIPAGTEIISESNDWNGTLLAPTVQSNDSLEIDVDGEVKFAVKVGADTALNFSQPVKLVLAGQAGHKAGYLNHSNEFSAITERCDDDPATTITNNVSECFTEDGNDLIIWTNHFSTFLAYNSDPSKSLATTGVNKSLLMVLAISILTSAMVVLIRVTRFSKTIKS